MSAASSMYPYGACECWGTLEPGNVSGEPVLVCRSCGEVTPLNDPADATEADGTDLFDIPGAKLSVRELDGRATYHPDRAAWDALDDKADIDIHPPTASFPWSSR